MKGELEGGGVEGGRGGGLGGPSRPQGPSAHLLHTQEYFPSCFKRGRTNLHNFACIEFSSRFLFLFQ